MDGENRLELKDVFEGVEKRESEEGHKKDKADSEDSNDIKKDDIEEEGNEGEEEDEGEDEGRNEEEEDEGEDEGEEGEEDENEEEEDPGNSMEPSEVKSWKDLEKFVGGKVPVLNFTPEIAALDEKAVLKEAKEQDFLADFDFEDVIADGRTFNKLLNKVYKAGAVAGAKGSMNYGLKNIPTVTKALTAKEKALKEISDKVYELNPDLNTLAGRREFALTVQSVLEESPELNDYAKLAEVLKLATQRARKSLGLKKKVEKKKKKKAGLPKKGTGGKRGGVKKKSKLTPEQQMMKDLGVLG